ncbi:peptidyl-prolyl cis-trans isomerase [Bacillus salitolerans]|uniref:peptidylprolyl isomerase n=1 Tax=Bacillus salitolerans TaxID=1437434 RepID=A0ABW4LPB1_9BACI
MANKGLWMIIFALVVTNCLSLGFLYKEKGNQVEMPASVETASTIAAEVVATVGDENITQQEWLHELEQLYGKETLKEIINRKVIYQLADKYNVSISDEVIDQEMTMIRAMYNSMDHEQLMDETEWRTQLEYTLLLEEILTKDVTITEDLIQDFYEENQTLYEIPDSYHLSHIIVETKEEANEVIKELENGSDFSVLAMERSIDEFSSNQGGDLGFITKESGYLPNEYVDALSSLKENQWYQPIKVNEGYAILYLHETVVGKNYSFEEVKDHIRRQLALGQMEGKVTAEQFWDEIEVNWFYESK